MRKPSLGCASAGKMCERASKVQDKDEKMKGIPPSATASAARCFCRLLRCCFSRWCGVWSSTPESQERFSSLFLGFSRAILPPSLLLSLSLPLSRLSLVLSLPLSPCLSLFLGRIRAHFVPSAAAASSLKVLQGQFLSTSIRASFAPRHPRNVPSLTYTYISRCTHARLALSLSFCN